MADPRSRVPPPYGTEAYDLGALNDDQQQRLYQFKINTRIANEYYLRNHPEVELLLGEFMRSVLLERPDNIREFASTYYTDARLPEKIQMMVKERAREMDQC
ncbi:RIIa domain-containing protein 1-like [Hemiscyllium ocellatum]|uniref:RIIa domain-containing protein 1-like n=1 Tax=Hemiscyllium ocellatum TaxID=170820 RepID=UPI002966FEF0|nr:RIIa domain-containing protein 1-like [Hemiscyllium ocellatum]